MLDVRHVRVTEDFARTRLTVETGPLLLGSTYDLSELPVQPNLSSSGNWKDLPKHRDEDQVQLDVDRSFIYYPNGILVHCKHQNIADVNL